MKQLTNQEWRGLLSGFVAGEDSIHVMLIHPFRQNGYVCATDTRVLIRVAETHIPPAEEGMTDFVSAEFPSVDKVIPHYAPQFSVSLAALMDAFVKSDINYDLLDIDCPNCDSDCQVEWKHVDGAGHEHSKWDDCPLCHGSGMVANASNLFCVLDGKNMNAHSMLILYHTMNALSVEKALVSYGREHQIRFTLADGVDVLLMPYSEIPDTYKSPVKIKIEKV